MLLWIQAAGRSKTEYKKSLCRQAAFCIGYRLAAERLNIKKSLYRQAAGCIGYRLAAARLNIKRESLSAGSLKHWIQAGSSKTMGCSAAS